MGDESPTSTRNILILIAVLIIVIVVVVAIYRGSNPTDEEQEQNSNIFWVVLIAVVAIVVIMFFYYGWAVGGDKPSLPGMRDYQPSVNRSASRSSESSRTSRRAQLSPSRSDDTTLTRQADAASRSLSPMSKVNKMSTGGAKMGSGSIRRSSRSSLSSVGAL